MLPRTYTLQLSGTLGAERYAIRDREAYAVGFSRKLVTGMLWAWSCATLAAPLADIASRSIVQVRTYTTRAAPLMLGSAVTIAPARVATNCHVLRGAQRIEIVDNGRSLPATLDMDDSSRDLCLLNVVGLTIPVAHAASTITVGQKVFAAGFPAGKSLVVSEGHVVALHDYDGGDVIQVSAPFDYGASGGALFDESGRVLGILTFRPVPVARFTLSLRLLG